MQRKGVTPDLAKAIMRTNTTAIGAIMVHREEANTLIFAHADAASGVRNILKMRADGLEVGPILMGMGNKAHIVSPSITARGLLNMAAIAGTPVAHYG
jgi:phosphotransacetylase